MTAMCKCLPPKERCQPTNGRSLFEHARDRRIATRGMLRVRLQAAGVTLEAITSPYLAPSNFWRADEVISVIEATDPGGSRELREEKRRSIRRPHAGGSRRRVDRSLSKTSSTVSGTWGGLTRKSPTTKACWRWA